MVRRSFTGRFEARKKAYERHRLAKIAALEARRAQYERERESLLGLGIGISPVRRRPGPPAARVPSPYRGARVETVKPETPPKEPLVDVFDEEDRLRVDVQLKDIPWPEGIIGELGEVSFKHGVLEFKLKKRELGGLTEEERGALEAAEVGKVTAKVKEKFRLKLKRRMPKKRGKAGAKGQRQKI